MAGDWIKMRADLFTHPKVVRISSALNADTLRTVGGLMSVWCLFDAHSEDGHLEGYGPDVLDAHLRWPGFSAAMIAVGWLCMDGESGLFLPDFDTHNGISAKRRAQEADRKRSERSSKSRPQTVRDASAFDADKKRTREEKRREDIDTPLPPVGGEDDLFEDFWRAYPRKVGKDAARKAFTRRKVGKGVLAQMLEAIAAQRNSTQWLRDGGQYIPHPATWLNDGRWQDESVPSAWESPGVAL